jgi:hypothetical protein
MMKIRLVWAVLAMAMALAPAAQAQWSPTTDEAAVTFDNDFSTQYNWRGYDTFDDHGAWMPSVNVDLYGTGWSFNVWGAQPFGSGSENFTELDYTLQYGNTAYEGEAHQVDYFVNYIYYDFPKTGSSGDAQEVGVGVAFPNLIESHGNAIVPSYFVSKFWLSQGGESAGFHRGALETQVEVPGCPQALDLFTDIWYNDGALGADHEWSHATVGVSTDIEADDNLTLTPYVRYQISMDDSVNEDNEVWGGLLASYRF